MHKTKYIEQGYEVLIKDSAPNEKFWNLIIQMGYCDEE